MAIYMKVPGVSGNVTAKGYEKWIEVSSLSREVDVSVGMQTGTNLNRFNSLPSFSGFEITKPKDAASHALLESMCIGKVFPEIDIHQCTTGATISAYAKYRLSNAIVTNIYEVASSTHRPIEVIDLAYTKIETTYIPRDHNNKAMSPVSSGYNIETGQMM